MFQKILLAIVVVLLFAAFSNPSLQSFKEYIGNKHGVTLSRPSNYFVFSIYQCNGNRYIGLIGNFFYIKKEQSNQINQSSSSDIQFDDEPGPFGPGLPDTLNKDKFKYDHSKSDDENLDNFIKINKIKINKAAR